MTTPRQDSLRARWGRAAFERSRSKSDATESTTGGSRVKNLAEKIAAIRERRERHKDILAELDQTGESQISLTHHRRPARDHPS